MPRFNLRLIVGLGAILIGVLGLIAIIMFMVVRFRPSAPPDEAGGGIGALPGVGEGPGGTVREGGEGGLPSAEGEIPIPNDQYPIGRGTGEARIDVVAQGGYTQATPVIQGFPVNPTVTRDGGIQYYDRRDQKFYRTTADGGKRLLSDEEFPGVVEVAWSPKDDSGILTYADGAHVYYDFTKGTLAVLPREMADPAFRDDGGAIAYKLETGDARNNWLMVSSPNGSGARAVQATGENGEQVAPAWSPDNKIAALFRKPRGIDREEIFFVGLEGENFVSLEVQGSRFEGIWAPDGRSILYHTVLAGDEYRPNLWIAEAGPGGSRRVQQIGFRTWIDRCAFSTDGGVVYCAVPRTLAAGAGLAPQAAGGAEYDIWSYQVASGITEAVATPSVGGSQALKGVRGLQVAPDGSALYLQTFVNVYKVRLK